MGAALKMALGEREREEGKGKQLQEIIPLDVKCEKANDPTVE